VRVLRASQLPQRRPPHVGQPVTAADHRQRPSTHRRLPTRHRERPGGFAEADSIAPVPPCRRTSVGRWSVVHQPAGPVFNVMPSARHRDFTVGNISVPNTPGQSATPPTSAQPCEASLRPKRRLSPRRCSFVTPVDLDDRGAVAAQIRPPLARSNEVTCHSRPRTPPPHVRIYGSSIGVPQTCEHSPPFRLASTSHLGETLSLLP
jgi:hypothetical protein